MFKKGQIMFRLYLLNSPGQKTENVNWATYVAFIDFEKAFDRVNWATVWAIMAKKGGPTILHQNYTEPYVEKIVIEKRKPSTAP